MKTGLLSKVMRLNTEGPEITKKPTSSKITRRVIELTEASDNEDRIQSNS